MSAFCLIYVDLPAILGPVISIRRFKFVSRSVSFGTNVPDENCSTTGWRPPSITIISDKSTSGAVYLFFTATEASDRYTSSSDSFDATSRMRMIFSFTKSRMLQKISYSSLTILSDAPRTVASNSFSSSVINLSQFARVCFLMYLSGTSARFDFVTSM